MPLPDTDYPFAPETRGLVRVLAAAFRWLGVILPILWHGSAGAQWGSMIPGKFVDRTPSSGIHFEHKASHTSKKYLPETMGAGVALFDYDNDGRLDVFLVNGAPLSDPTPAGTI
ncbi:MAG: hypothetical protein JOZ33_18845, partial [Acidobacteriaceae bacterium]|nr:hypothetical protein [Acidobacteriaceae bacterium]